MTRHTERREDTIQTRQRYADSKAKSREDFKRVQRDLKYGFVVDEDEDTEPPAPELDS